MADLLVVLRSELAFSSIGRAALSFLPSRHGKLLTFDYLSLNMHVYFNTIYTLSLQFHIALTPLSQKQLLPVTARHGSCFGLGTHYSTCTLVSSNDRNLWWSPALDLVNEWMIITKCMLQLHQSLFLHHLWYLWYLTPHKMSIIMFIPVSMSPE